MRPMHQAAALPGKLVAKAQEDTRRGVELHRAGDLEAARARYEEVMRNAPGFPDVWHFHGLLQHQGGDTAAGIREIQHALKLAPRYADAWANLAILQLAQSDHLGCEASLQRVLKLTPRAIEPRITLARLRRALGRSDEAESELRAALELDPAASGAEVHANLHSTLGNVLLSQRRFEEACEHHRKAIELLPGVHQFHSAYGLTLCQMGRLDEAAEQYRRLLERDPDDVRAQHLLAACGGAAVPERADDRYVKAMFDTFSSTFDACLARLGYRAPALLADLLHEVQGAQCRDLTLVDAGCGTGLFGERVRERCARLVGVDLSAGMLQRARQRKLYDDLHEAELTSWLSSQHEAFDVVASTDTLCYFGALDDAFAAAHDALRPGGWLYFSVEHQSADAPEFTLQHHGRYAHSRPYVERALDRARFRDVRIRHDTLRKEAGAPVAGLVVAARRATHADLQTHDANSQDLRSRSPVQGVATCQ